MKSSFGAKQHKNLEPYVYWKYTAYTTGQNIRDNLKRWAKQNKTRKLWYLLLRTFWLLLPKFFFLVLSYLSKPPQRPRFGVRYKQKLINKIFLEDFYAKEIEPTEKKYKLLKKGNELLIREKILNQKSVFF